MTVSPHFRSLVSEYQSIFVEELPNQLPPKRDLEFEITLQSDQPPPVRPVIRLSTEEIKELKKQLQSMLDKGFIRPSSSPYGAPVFFVKKKDGGLRMVCDYRALNKITVSDSHPLPLIQEALDQVAGATIFSQLDLVGAYHQMRIREEDVPKTAIRTRFGSFEWRVLCFGLTNAPAAFSRLISTLLKELNGECIVLFLDDVLVYSSSIEEHEQHLRRLFEILKEHGLYARRSKCKIGVPEVDFLGFKITKEGVYMQQRLMSAILDWPDPKSVHHVRQFIGLANFYRRFIKNYAQIIRPISDIIRKNSFIWDTDQENSFSKLKEALTSAPVLCHASAEKTFIVSTDASKYAVGASLEQNGHPIAYLSHRLSDPETRWDTGDQELLAFMIALREWSVYLRGRKFILRTDHEPIRYLQSKSKLTGRQYRWLDTLQEFSYDVEHIPGRQHVVPDALSRRPDHTPQIRLKAITMRDPQFPKRIKNAYPYDKWAKSLIPVLRDNETSDDRKVMTHKRNYSFEDGYIYWKGTNDLRIYVPDHGTIRTDIINHYHGVGHLGIDKVYNSCTRDMFWPKMHEQITNYVLSCKVCQANKSQNLSPAGLLQPLKIPPRCWHTVTTDFLTELPMTERGKDSICVIVDKLSKRAIFIPLTKTAKAIDIAQIFQDHLFSKHGVPEVIVSDRDPKFTSHFWASLTELLDIKLNLSTANHPQTDGQSENMIRTLSNMLRDCIQKEPKSWDNALSQFEYEYNCSKHTSTKLSPFEAELGFIPMNKFSKSLADCKTKCQSSFDVLERREAYSTIIRDNMATSIANQKFYADQHRRDVSFNAGDWVMLKADAVSISRRADLPKKWQSKFLGPLEIVEVMGPVTYKIELPPAMKQAHNVFHVSKLKKYHKPLDENNLVSVTIDTDGTQEHVVKTILGKKKEGRRVFYLVQFENDSTANAVWMHKSGLTNCQELIMQFNQKKLANSEMIDADVDLQEKGECDKVTTDH